MRSFLWTLTLFASVLADIPDGVLEWRSFQTVEYPGNDNVLDCMRTADGLHIHAVVLNEDGNSTWRWHLLTLNRFGDEKRRTLLAEEQGSLSRWLATSFTDQGMLLVVMGSPVEPGPASLSIIDPETAETVSSLELSMPHYVMVDITSVVPLENDTVLVAGAGWNADYHSCLFLAGIAPDGSVVWQSELTGGMDFVLETTTVEILEDGSILLSMEEDCFPGGITLYRLDNKGREMWQTFIDLDCEFTARCSDFLEMYSGDILMAGCFDHIFSGGYRGILESMDTALVSSWQRIDWYRDHTAFVSVQYTEEDEILAAGWVAHGGSRQYETEETDVLLAFVEEDGSGITGYTVVSPGEQIPRFIFQGENGELTVVGETHGEVFTGRVLIER